MLSLAAYVTIVVVFHSFYPPSQNVDVDQIFLYEYTKWSIQLFLHKTRVSINVLLYYQDTKETS